MGCGCFARAALAAAVGLLSLGASARAASLVENVTISPAPGSGLPTSGTHDFTYSFPKFDDALGTLTSVQVAISNNFQFRFEITSFLDSGYGSYSLGGPLTVAGAQLSNPSIGNGAMEFSGPHELNNSLPFNLTVDLSAPYPPAVLATFHAPGGGVGSLVWSPTIATSVTRGRVEWLAYLATSGGTVTFNYEPAAATVDPVAVPTPAAAASGLVLLAGLATKRRRHAQRHA